MRCTCRPPSPSIVRAALEAVPYDTTDINVYYTKCTFMTFYSAYILVYTYRQVAFQSSHIQRYILNWLVILSSNDGAIAVG